MHSGEHWSLGYRPGLDGLRAIAVLLVIGYHAARDWFPNGGVVGVTVFFVLSGFLITSLLLEEHERTGRVSVAGFYRRRALRLLPALFAMLAVAGSLAVLIGNVSPTDLLAVVAYVANWWAISHNLGMFEHMWTLAAEEQFYLVWPLALLVLRRSRWLPQILTLLAAELLTSRVVFPGDGAGNPVVLHTGAGCLIAGCALAAWMHQRPTPRPIPGWVPLAPLAGLLAAGWLSPSPAWAVVVAALSTVLVLRVVAASDVSPLTFGPLRAIGRRSYGLYLWHLPVFGLVGRTSLDRWTGVLVALAITAAVVEVSWRYVEQPFLRLKDRSDQCGPGGDGGGGVRGSEHAHAVEAGSGDRPVG